MNVAGETNGNVKWRDLAEIEARGRAEAVERFRQTDHRISAVESRVDAVESVLDQQRGARNLVYALIGTNVFLAVSTGLLVLDLLTHLP